jgi:hypothetical protein
MSRFTELNVIFALKSDTPEEIVDVLLLHDAPGRRQPKTIPTHPLFEGTLCRYMLCETGAEAYSNARMELSGLGRYLVSIRCNCENANGEIEKFISWVMPYIHARRGEFLGYTRPENGRGGYAALVPRLYDYTDGARRIYGRSGTSAPAPPSPLAGNKGPEISCEPHAVTAEQARAFKERRRACGALFG